MIFGLLLTLHIVVCLFLIAVILVQGGRGGLSDALGGSGGQSLFGGGANLVMAKVTAACAGLFMVTCLLLAKLSSQHGRSVTEQVPMALPAAALSLTEPVPSATPMASPATPAAEPIPASAPTPAGPTAQTQAPQPAAPTTPSP